MAAWLNIESALALTQADLEMIPHEAADAIAAACRIERLDLGSIRNGIARTSHPLMPLIVELSRVVGEPHGGWVHWGATTQNITQTGDVLILRKVHRVILGLLARIMTALAKLAERSADMVMAGRTHAQHAVPITFGLKVASWIDESAGISPACVNLNRACSWRLSVARQGALRRWAIAHPKCKTASPKGWDLRRCPFPPAVLLTILLNLCAC
jgi:adenylosuccinate lyase